MAQYRCDLRYTSKVVTQSMATPRAGDEVLVNVFCIYLTHCPRVVNHMPYKDNVTILSMYCDSDWASYVTSRRPTSGGLVMLGRHVLCRWIKLQTPIALSSGEAALNAAVPGGEVLSGVEGC